ncbi:superoxide dismutase family protein [Sphingomonas sp. So64.6b]|uniref:superoxide dismutase family protein n=1 Tax=Sphingomonas sp. So64.6b TaxID=2997354 RepID=UPI0016040BF1|nr:superoxide dismutase family protein [Sphingomonas sp. So64.6b]QNA83430.1 superoxide dismutase family protein [Sphingomonas sp. So64.6b]
MRTVLIGTAALAMLALAGCDDKSMETGMPLAGGAHAVAILKTAAGADVGRVSASEVAGGLRFTIDARGMPAGTHGAHVHTTGLCEGPEFTSAGGHWNPTGMKHGSMNPQGPHEGDLPNLIIGTDGRGTLGITIPGATMAGLLDGDGSALVVHAAADDLMTDPSGNSGARIACGVFGAS